MATTFKPFGLKPAYHPSGLDRATAFVGTNSFQAATDNSYNAPYSLSAGQAFYQYQPVGLNASNQLTIAATSATGESAGTIYGVFDGVEFTDSQGRRSVAKWASKTQLDSYTQIVFWIWTDPAMVYEAQSSGSIDASSIGAQYDFDATNNPTSGTSIGNGGAGFSTCALAATAVATTVQGQVRVIGLGREAAYPPGETNAWGDAKTIVQVQIANNTFVAPKASV
jgi:hypothetical protein